MNPARFLWHCPVIVAMLPLVIGACSASPAANNANTEPSDVATDAADSGAADAPSEVTSTEDSMDASSPCAEASTDVTVDNALGTLHGTLQTPSGCAPTTTVVLVVPGSGPTDRNGNSSVAGVTPNSYRLLAADLANRGIASLRYDKAGIGASVAAAPASEADLRFEMGADDAARWIKKLRDDPRFAKVAVVGHSEGALLAMLAAASAPVDAYVSLEGAGRPIGAVLKDQIAASVPDATLVATSNAILAKLENGETVADVPQALLAIFRPSVQPYLISWMKYDPAKLVATVAAPVMLVQGTTDVQVPVTDVQLLAAARTDAQVVVIDGMNHVLKAATLDTASQNAAYSSPTLPIVPRLLDALQDFLSDRD